MIVFAEQLTPRLKYIAAFIGTQVSGHEWTVTNDVSVYTAHTGARINYSTNVLAQKELRIEPYGLLYQQGISDQDIDISQDDPERRLFKNDSDTGFDIFSAVFYLLSRYEEYLQRQRDEYGRYPHTSSIAFIYGFLHRPLIDEWLVKLAEQLKGIFPGVEVGTDGGDRAWPQPGSGFGASSRTFSLRPTYDIDIAWSYKGKGLKRTAGALFRSILTGTDFRRRVGTLLGRQRDPFDSFNWLDELHRRYNLTPHYFFLLAAKPGVYDKNNDPAGREMQQLVSRLSAKYLSGIHPSWRSGDEPSLMKQEKDVLDRLASRKTDASRQHYIRFVLPDTFRQLEALGIRHEYSMGYGSINGFRASTSVPFFWYDLEAERVSPMMLHPFCFMDANSFYEQGQSVPDTMTELTGYYERLRAVDGTMTMIWHNHFLGTDPLFAGWKELYENFLMMVSDPGFPQQQGDGISTRG